MTVPVNPVTIPKSYDLKRRVAHHRDRFWCGSELRGLPAAPIYLFPDQARFDSDEVDRLSQSIMVGPLRLPHEGVLFEVTEQGGAGVSLAVYAATVGSEVEGFVFRFDRARQTWTDVVARARFLPNGVADVEAHPALASDSEAGLYFQAMTGIVWRSLGLLAAGTAVRDHEVSRLRRPKLARSGVSGWSYHVVDIEPHALAAALGRMSGTHAPPRWHIRRGHWRQLSDGRRVFVRECEVGDAARGGIVKDYRVDLGSAA